MVLPMELKIDINGFFYINDDYIRKYPERLINIDYNGIPNSYFYELLTSSDYAIKYNLFPLNKDGLFSMLLNLQKVKKSINDIDFPIGYYKEDNEIYGEIIRFYKNAPSLYTVTKRQDINEISKYYYHDEDSIHNVYLMLFDILNLIEELFDNNIFYTDIHTGNFVIHNNQVKLIDFDYQFINFNSKKSLEMLKTILFNYETLVHIVNKKFNLGEYSLDNPVNFTDTKIMLEQMENNVRKGI